MTGTLDPISIRRIDDRTIVIGWSDGVDQTLTARQMRDACPCATCLEKAMAKWRDAASESETRSLPIISVAPAPLKVTKMSPVGNYAYQVAFSDGHNTGVYTFDLLRSIES